MNAINDQINPYLQWLKEQNEDKSEAQFRSDYNQYRNSYSNIHIHANHHQNSDYYQYPHNYTNTDI